LWAKQRALGNPCPPDGPDAGVFQGKRCGARQRIVHKSTVRIGLNLLAAVARFQPFVPHVSPRQAFLLSTGKRFRGLVQVLNPAPTAPFPR
jgi:hypothetical protein